MAQRARRRRAAKPGVSSEIELEIAGLGAQGDGTAPDDGGTLFVPFTLPGERVVARRIGPHHAVPVAWRRQAPSRNPPACPHFGVCGGCAVQHLGDGAYAAWKLDQLARALRQRGFGDIPTAPLRRTPPRARRRAIFGIARTGGAVAVGFRGYRSSQVVDMRDCAVLDPAVLAAVPALRALVAALAADGQAVEAMVTRTDSGLDMLVAGPAAPGRAERETLAAFAHAHDAARVAWRHGDRAPEVIVQRRAPTVTFGGVAVQPPPGAFLQASPQGEQAIVEAVAAAVADARHVADLFAGCGTLSFPLARRARVRAVEGDAALAAALDAAARRAGLGAGVAVETRDLARRPVLAEELSPFDAVVFDPPRDGAAAQAAAIAQSRVPVAVGVSCNPATFARDARILADGGYRLELVTPVDQFLWTPHLELVGVFRR